MSLIIMRIKAASSTIKTRLDNVDLPFNVSYFQLWCESCSKRSFPLSISVTLTPKFSSTTTTSPRAIRFLFTKMSTGSPASLSNSMTDPGEIESNSSIDFSVRTNSTVTYNGMSINSPKSTLRPAGWDWEIGENSAVCTSLDGDGCDHFRSSRDEEAGAEASDCASCRSVTRSYSRFSAYVVSGGGAASALTAVSSSVA